MTRPCLSCGRDLEYADWERPAHPMCPACIGTLSNAPAHMLRDEAATLRRMAAEARQDGHDDLAERWDSLADLEDRYADERSR